MRPSRITILGVVLALGLAGACGSRPLRSNVDTLPSQDAGAPPSPDAGAPPAPDAGASLPCPPPAVLTPADVPAGYLEAEKVTLTRPTDGDTANFRFSSGSHAVRFLFLDTEESWGDKTTAFGTLTSQVVGNILRGAAELVIVVRESPWEAGAPNTDVYDRWLGLVFVDGELLETRLIREGWSGYYSRFGCAPEPIHTALLLAESEARVNQRGIWAPGHPTDYRPIFSQWIGGAGCRPNPFFNQAYCATPAPQ